MIKDIYILSTDKIYNTFPKMSSYLFQELYGYYIPINNILLFFIFYIVFC